ncbi:MAG: alpha/beta hydrolase [Actinomycetota bacterium]
MKSSSLVPPTLAYDIRFRGTLCGTSWARLLPGAEPVIECAQRMEDVPAIGLRKSQKRSLHRFTAAGRPLGGWIEDSFGNRVEYGPVDDVDLVLEANMFPLTACLLKFFHGIGGGRYRALLPETGETIPYTLSARDGGLESSLGERIILGADGLIAAVSFPTAEFAVERSIRRFPAWRSGKTVRRGYQPPADLLVEEVSADGVSATCVRAAQPKAVAVFVGGTGVYDRHGFTARLDLGYHRILDELARLGVASVRYERLDRPCASLAEAETRLDFDTLCDGAGRWLDWLGRQHWCTGLPKIVIGHSLGGLVALALASQREDIDGAVLLSTPGRPFRRILAEQNDWLHAQLGLSEQSTADADALHQALIGALEQDAPWSEDTVDPRLLPWKRQQRLYRSILDLDPCDFVRVGRCPLLLVHGGKDVQVPLQDARSILLAAHAVGRHATLAEQPELDHLLRRSTSQGLAALATYSDRRRRVPARVLKQIAAWACRDNGDKSGTPGPGISRNDGE